MPGAADTRVCGAGSDPRSHAGLLRSSAGGGRILLVMASCTCSASCPSGRCGRIVDRVVRSMGVPVALRLPALQIKVALPVAGGRSVGDLGRPVAGHGHGLAGSGSSGPATCHAVAPGRHGAFGHTDRAGGPGEVHAAAHRVRGLRASRCPHVPQPLVLGPVELEHHVSIPSESKVSRRSLEPAGLIFLYGGLRMTQSNTGSSGVSSTDALMTFVL